MSSLTALDVNRAFAGNGTWNLGVQYGSGFVIAARPTESVAQGLQES